MTATVTIADHTAEQTTATITYAGQTREVELTQRHVNPRTLAVSYRTTERVFVAKRPTGAVLHEVYGYVYEGSRGGYRLQTTGIVVLNRNSGRIVGWAE
jgi:hypothetical protein